jgi:hypothetical protein
MLVDPPEGWRYGFPRTIPIEIEADWSKIEAWIIDCGYPKEKRELLEFCRMWETTSGFLQYQDKSIGEDSWY